MNYIPTNKLLPIMASSDMLWWSIILIPPSFWIFQLLNVSVILYLVGALASAVFGSLSWIALRIYTSPKFKVNGNSLGLPKIVAEFQRSNIEEIINSRLNESCHLDECNESNDGDEASECTLSNGAPIVSRNIDQELNEVIDSIFKCYIGSWMEDLLFDNEEERQKCGSTSSISTPGNSSCNKLYSNASLDELHKIFRHDTWYVVRNIYERLKGVDWVKLLACDVVKKVTDHLEKIRVVSNSTTGTGGSAVNGNNTDPLGRMFTSNNDQPPECPTFYVKPFLMEVEKELEYLSKISDLAVLLLTPISYSACRITRQLLKEILSKQVLFNLIEMITDPDYINQKLLLLVHKVQQDQKASSEPRFSVDGKVLGLSERVLKENDNEEIMSTHSKPPLGRFDSAESETGSSSETFQSFLTQINESNDAEQIKRIHFNILTEIVQATTLCNVQAAKGIGSNDSLNNGVQEENTNKFKIQEEQVKRLQRYIGQLVQAKTLCDNRLRCLERRKQGAEGINREFRESDFTYQSSAANPITGQQCISLAFDAIMNSPFSRRYFYSYLENHGKATESDHKTVRDQRSCSRSVSPPYQDLLGFWAAVEELKNSDKKVWHQLATEIFYTYINKPQDPWKIIKITRSDLKRIESFLVGDSGPDVFYCIQTNVLETLEQEHYPAFLVSETCYKMLENAQENSITLCEMKEGSKSHVTSLIDLVTPGKIEPGHIKTESEKSTGSPGVWRNIVNDGEDIFPNERKSSTAESILVSEHSNFAKSHLEHIGERLQNKTQALKALKSSLKPESKVLTKLSDEVERLLSDRHEVQQHLLRMEAWSDNLSYWRAHIQSVNYLEEEETLQVSIIVYVPTDSKSKMSCARSNKTKTFDDLNRDSSTLPTSWVCVKEVSDFHNLNRELIPYVSWIKKMELPAGTDVNTNRNHNSGRSGTRFGSDISNSSTAKRPGSGFFGSKSRRIKLHSNKAWQEKTRLVLQRYIDTILTDDHLNQSEIIYSFLNPCPEYYSRTKGAGNSSEQEPFSKISKRLLTISQNSPVDEFGRKTGGLRDIYTKRKDIEIDENETNGKKSRNTKSVFPSSISNFFNDSTADNFPPISEEQPETSKRFCEENDFDNGQDEENNEQHADEKSDYEDTLGYRNDASMILDYELGETSRQYFTDEVDGMEGRVETPKFISGGDAIAEPMYALIGEVFDMRGVFKILRKSLMTFVQITFGSTINRQLRNIVSWVTSELEVLQYIQNFRIAFWPNDDISKEDKIKSDEEIRLGVSASQSGTEQGANNRTDKDKLATRREIESALFPESANPCGCIPEVLVNLVGQQAARNGAMRVFESLQDSMLNKVLAYELLELACKTLFPELEEGYCAHYH